jgi:hypothetical protein
MNGCQPYPGCTNRRAFEVTYRTAPVKARGETLPGAEFSGNGVCRSHADPFKDQIRKDGGEIVTVVTLPEPSSPPIWTPELEPAAVAAVATPEPAPAPTSPRRRPRGKSKA